MKKTEAESEELIQLRARVAELERERAELIEHTNWAIAAAQDRAYWLDRWHIDLNAIMKQRWTGEVRGALRFLRLIYRQVIKLIRAVKHRLGERRGVV